VTLADELESLLPDLETGRRIHSEWVSFLRDNPDFYAVKAVGPPEFHARLTEVYEHRIDVVKRAVRCLRGF
jgi:hypothetical protein